MWKIENHDTGPDGDNFVAWWTVTDGEREFETYDEEGAKWLCHILNELEASNSAT